MIWLLIPSFLFVYLFGWISAMELTRARLRKDFKWVNDLDEKKYGEIKWKLKTL